MASLDKETPSPEKKESKGKGQEVNEDAQLVTMMGMKMLDQGGLQTIQKALETSEDPAQVTGQFLAQMVGRMAEMTANDLGIAPAVYAQPNGFLDQILDYIEAKLSLPKEFSDQVYGETMEVMKAAAMDPKQAQQMQQGGPPQGQPPGPLGPQAPGPQPGVPLDQGVM